MVTPPHVVIVHAGPGWVVWVGLIVNVLAIGGAAHLVLRAIRARLLDALEDRMTTVLGRDVLPRLTRIEDRSTRFAVRLSRVEGVLEGQKMARQPAPADPGPPDP